MTMHLVRGMSSLNTQKRKNKKKTAKLIKAEKEHEEFLARMGVGKKKSDYRHEIPDYSTGPRMTSDEVAGNGNKKESVKYTGTLIKGIATMHKSNAIPVTSGEQAIEVSKMRRG